MPNLLYIVGIPGAGKSTLLTATLKGFLGIRLGAPVQHSYYPGKSTIQLGDTRGIFSGTDTLAMDAQPAVLRWLTSPEFAYTTVIGEGDRLGNDKFFTALKDAGWNVSVVLLSVSEETAQRRRAARSQETKA